MLRAVAVSCKTGSLSQHFTEGFAPRGCFKIPGAVEQPELQQGCAQQLLYTTGSWAVPCSTSQLCHSEPTTAQVRGLTWFCLWFSTLIAVYNSSRENLPFSELFLMFLPPEEVLWNFPGYARVSFSSQAVLAPQLFWESSVTFTEQDDRIME